MALDKSRYSKDQRYEVILDNGEDHTRWSDLLGNVSSVVSGTEHITAAKSVSFDKAAGVSADGYIIRPIDKHNGSNLDSFSSEGHLLSSVYLPDLTDVASYNVALLMSSGTENGVFYSVDDTDLAVGWNHIKFDCNTYATSSGCGADWSKIKYVAVGVTLDDVGDSLSGILVDSVRIQMPTATLNFDPSIDNITVNAGTEIAIKNGDAADELSVDAANTARTVSTNVIPVQHIDTEGKVLKSGADSDSPIYTQDIGGGGGGGGGSMLYMSPEDFIATYTSASGITLTGLSWTPSLEQFVGVTQFNSTGLAASFTPSTNDFDFDASAGLLNLGGSPSFAATDQGYRVQIYGPDKAFSQPVDATKVVDLSPPSQKYSYETVADVTNESDASTSYYINMDGYRVCMVQYEVVGGSDVLTLTVHGTLQDGTAASSCLYQDITANGMDNLVHTTASGSYDYDTIIKTQDGSSWKYLKLDVTSSLGSSDGDYKIYVKKYY